MQNLWESCPLTSIMEDKIKDDPNSGMISMYGNYQVGGSSQKDKVILSESESEFLSGQISYIYGHPESFTTEIGKKILEANEQLQHGLVLFQLVLFHKI